MTPIMNTNPSESPKNPGGEDWSGCRPEVVARPTYWPAGIALASTLILWGMISSIIITIVGVCLFALSIAGWIGEIRYERKSK